METRIAERRSLSKAIEWAALRQSLLHDPPRTEMLVQLGCCGRDTKDKPLAILFRPQGGNVSQRARAAKTRDLTSDHGTVSTAPESIASRRFSISVSQAGSTPPSSSISRLSRSIPASSARSSASRLIALLYSSLTSKIMSRILALSPETRHGVQGDISYRLYRRPYRYWPGGYLIPHVEVSHPRNRSSVIKAASGVTGPSCLPEIRFARAQARRNRRCRRAMQNRRRCS